MANTYQFNVLTIDGAALIAQATAANPIVYVGALSRATAAASAAELATAPASWYTGKSGEIVAVSATGNVAEVRAVWRNAGQSQLAKSVAITARLASQSDAQAVVVTAMSDPDSTIVLPGSTDTGAGVAIPFYVQIGATGSVEVTPGACASIADLARFMSIHSAGNPNAGENQNIYGEKTFQNLVEANKGITTSYIHAYGIDEGVCIQFEGEYGESGYITYGDEGSQGIEFVSQNTSPAVDDVSARDCFVFKNCGEDDDHETTVLRIARSAIEYYTYTGWPLVVESELRILGLGRADSSDPDILCNQINFIPNAPQGQSITSTLGDANHLWASMWTHELAVSRVNLVTDRSKYIEYDGVQLLFHMKLNDDPMMSISANLVQCLKPIENVRYNSDGDEFYIELGNGDRIWSEGPDHSGGIAFQNSQLHPGTDYVEIDFLDGNNGTMVQMDMETMVVAGYLYAQSGIQLPSLNASTRTPLGVPFFVQVQTTANAIVLDRGYIIKPHLTSVQVPDGTWDVYDIGGTLLKSSVVYNFCSMSGVNSATAFSSSNYPRTVEYMVLSYTPNGTITPFMLVRVK